MPAIEAVTRITPPSPSFRIADEACFMPRNTERDQHGEGVVPVLDAGLGDRPEGAADAGIEIGDVEPAEAPHRLGHHRRDVGLLGDVAAHEGDVVAMTLRLGDRQRLRAVGLVEVGHHDLGAIGQEAHDGRAAHAARPAGHDRDFSCQSAHVCPFRFALRSHGGVAPPRRQA